MAQPSGREGQGAPLIAGTPVARWSWGEFGHDTDLVREAVHRFLLTLEVLDRHRLATPHGGRVTVEVPEMGRRSILFRADLPLGKAAADTAEDSPPAEALVERIRQGIAPGEIGGVDLYARCDGIVETGTGAEAVEGLFALSAEVSEGYFHLALTTFCDAWMPFDLRGRAQEAVFAANRPRLASALAGIAEALDVEIDPDDATWFAVPTESGVENHYEDDGSASDVWGSFEIPYRNGIFNQTPKFTAGYGRQASGAVRYVPVAGSEQVLGYPWASDAEAAASFEPRDAADLDAYRAGLVWLDRLQAAYDRGLSPAAALVELGRLPADPVAGRPEADRAADVDEFWKLGQPARQEHPSSKP
ncbi:hypothetical protein [Streptomyces sp. NPDC057939]|uniref:hypothetical protein n=1 Tax=Streptomyces sp. NPDC057939 TaxID=3346284 RepID=UPI0036E9483F